MPPSSRKDDSFAGECPCAGHTLDKLLQPAILALLCVEPLHGYRLVERLGDMPMLGGRRPDASGVYRCLRLMEGLDVVEATWDASRTGPARKSYRITPRGRQCLAQWVRTLDEYRRNIDELVHLARTALGPDVSAPPCGD